MKRLVLAAVLAVFSTTGAQAACVWGTVPDGRGGCKMPEKPRSDAYKFGQQKSSTKNFLGVDRPRNKRVNNTNRRRYGTGVSRQ